MSHWANCYSLGAWLLSSIRRRSFIRPWAGRLAALFLLALALTVFVADEDVIADILFQSPASPPAQPPPVQPPAQEAPAEPAPPAQPPAEEAPAQPPAQAAPTEQETPAVPTETTEFASPIAPIDASPVTPALSTSTEPPTFVQPTPLPRSRSRDDIVIIEEQSSSQFILDQVEFIDTIVVSGAYAWLCCGIMLLLLVPLVFLLLQIRGQIKIQREEDL